MAVIGPTFFSSSRDCRNAVGFFNDSTGDFSFHSATTSPKDTSLYWGNAASSAVFTSGGGVKYQSELGTDTFNSPKLTVLNGAWSIQAMVYPTSSPATGRSIVTLYSDASAITPKLTFSVASTQKLAFSLDGGGAAVFQSTNTLNLNQWNKCAITKSGSTWILTLNGVSNSITYSADLSAYVTRAINIGNGLDGNIDHVRMSKVARLTGFDDYYPRDDPDSLFICEFEDGGICAPFYGAEV